MAIDTHEVLQRINSHLATHPNASLQAIAEKLGMESREIERCLNETGGTSFQQFCEGRRLAEAFRQLNAKRSLANQLWETKCTPTRIVIPGATIQYRIRGFWPYRCAFSNPCPVIDLNSSGLGFLTDLSQKPGKCVSLILTLPGINELLELKGRIVYSLATGISGYRYRVGIQFLPFAKRRGRNSFEALAILNRLEKESINLQE